jgi:hypothetical protein
MYHKNNLYFLCILSAVTDYGDVSKKRDVICSDSFLITYLAFESQIVNLPDPECSFRFDK